MMQAGIGAITGGIANALKWPAIAVGGLTGGISGSLDKTISVSALTYYKLISSTKAEYFTYGTLYIDGVAKKTTQHTWTATIDTNID